MICECKITGLCVCRFSKVREAFDSFAGDDLCVGPNQVEKLLGKLRFPAPCSREDIEECVNYLADGRTDSSEPRMMAVPFEKWYRGYYNEYEEDDEL